ncbi:MAG: TonB-dependent receptor [Proteobacteria bacterium]|nr:TonB-dependent receptor [Pseudomonadota bacterium]
MNRKLLASAICASLFVAATAFAQDATTSQSQAQDKPAATQDAATSSKSDADKKKSKEEPSTLQGITVTGSLLNRPEYQTTSPVQVVNLDADVAAGQFTTADFLQSTAVAAGSTQINNQFGGFVIEGGTGVQTVNLRGLGSNRTLILLDGQRPGPAGTRGQVGSFDLNVIPQVILQRAEIVKDGSSSIYGSDAVAGVVNLITKKRLDHTETTFMESVPEHGGGQQYLASIGTGWNFENGNISLAAQIDRQEALKRGQRDFLNCTQDYVFGTNGQRIDRADHSITAGTPLSGCNNLYANTVIYYWGANNRFVPSVDGSTQGPFPGYHLRPYPTKTYANSPQAYYEDQLNFPFYGNTYAIDQQQRSSIYGSSNFNFGSVNWDTQWLYNHRETNHLQYRQFFPIVYAAQAAGWVDPLKPSNASKPPYFEPIMPFPFASSAEVDYFYGASKLSGGFTATGSWSWEVNATYSRSNGDYKFQSINLANSGDLSNPGNELDNPLINYFEPCVLNGQCMNKLVNAVGQTSSGNTVYTQATINALANGNLFDLPAGSVSAAFGAEYRHTSIDDKPPPASWGLTGATQTKGSDNVHEIFGEIGVPLLEGLPGVESLNVDLSARQFKYASVGDSSHVWKYGLNWQILPSFRARGTIGTSYRAPGLYELYLGNQSGFLSQASIDPCINWSDSNNDFLKKNCAAAGIPGDYAASGNPSATSYQGGGKGFLKPETSRAKSAGLVWSPTFANLNVAVDYFDYFIRGEIDTLGASDILFGCYGTPVYPNAFCNLFNRKPNSDPANPNMITDVHATYININSERNRGYDLQLNYNRDFSFGKLSADAQLTYTISDTQQLFDSSEASGFSSSEFVGYIGRPHMVGVFDASLERGNWTYYWQGLYTSPTSNHDLSSTFTYQGYPNAGRVIRAGWQLRHTVSAKYDAGKWSILFGIRNLFDQNPPKVSPGADTFAGVVGTTPLGGSQYDWFGRTYFARLNVSF